jgi:adenylate cyclase
VTNSTTAQTPSLEELTVCFEGAIPAVVATAAADGKPNVTFLSRVRMVDDERIALSNQFFSKTTRNVAENPQASVLLTDPVSYRQYRLALAYERTERRGPIFELLHDDVAAVAAMYGMQDVFKLRGADIYRVLHIEVVPGARSYEPEAAPVEQSGTRVDIGLLAALSSRLSRCPDLDTIVIATVDGLAELFGYQHSLLLLLDEGGTRLYTIASRGYENEGVGSEIPVGEGVIGMAAARCTPIRLGNVGDLSRYGQTVRRAYEDRGDIAPGYQIPFPGLTGTQSRMAVPAMAYGELLGVLVVESTKQLAYTSDDEALLLVVATLVGIAIESGQVPERPAAGASRAAGTVRTPKGERSTHVRYFEFDGSVFIDGDYLIKGVAGRLLWSLLRQYMDEGRLDFTNREVRLDPSLELPEFRDNFENRLVLLKRRLDERYAPIRIDKTGRGRFRLAIEAELLIESVPVGG